MFPAKCQVQNDSTNREKISCVCQNLQLRMYFDIKTSIFKLRPLFRFLLLINSFYRRYVFCIYNIYNISNISIHYPPLSNNYPTTIHNYPTTIQQPSNNYPTTIHNYPPTIHHYPPLNNHCPTTIQPLSAKQQNQYKSPVEDT